MRSLGMALVPLDAQRRTHVCIGKLHGLVIKLTSTADDCIPNNEIAVILTLSL
jgi:hypothetical protein